MNERDLFIEALAQPGPVERAAFLAKACGDDVALRLRLEELLRFHDSDRTLLGQMPIEILSTQGVRAGRVEPFPTEGVGSVIAGRYTLVELIGQGGMGSVYRAQQTEPVTREVAVKLIKAGMVSTAALVQFEAERQALAMMNHPNIARVYDGGSTATGQPFFVMEFVRGVPITRFCDERCLTPTARLALFVSVCQAIHHAHQKGIIHRDLKPSNILVADVDGRPTPTVIDFGVAKAIDQRLPEQRLTDLGMVVGTPEYMSPEQADPQSLDIDTRTDVYALGIILYELLVGSTPIESKELQRGAVLEMLRMVREIDPPRPSTRLRVSNETQVIAASRSTEPRSLASMLQGELDWVVMKSLEKDRSRRYESAIDLAKDVERYLSGEAVQAVPSSTRYRLRKFLVRNPLPVIAVSLFVLALVAGMGGTTWGMWRAERARRAEREQRLEADRAATAERTANEMAAKRLAQVEKGIEVLGSIFEGINPDRVAREGKPLTVVLGERVDRAAMELNEATAGDSLTLARLQGILARSQLGLGNHSKAIALLRNAKEIFTERLGPTHPDTLRAAANLGSCYIAARQFDEARSIFQDTLKIRTATLGHDHPDTLANMNNLALVYRETGKLDEAISLYEETADRTAASFGPDDPRTIMCLSNLAAAYYSTSQRDRALPMMIQVMNKRKAILGLDHPETISAMNNLGVYYLATGKFDLALPLLEEALTLTRSKLGPDHNATLDAMKNLSAVYYSIGKGEETLALLEEALRREKVQLGPSHRQTLKTMKRLADAYTAMKKPERAAPLYEELKKWPAK